MFEDYPYIINGSKLIDVVKQFVSKSLFEPLFVFGHGDTSKTAIVQRTLQEIGKEICTISVQENDTEITLPKLTENTVVEIAGEIAFIYPLMKQILRLDTSCPIIVEVTVYHDGDIRQLIRENYQHIRWVFYQETPEETLAYMRENNIHPIISDFLMAHPEQLGRQIEENKQMVEEGTRAIQQANKLLLAKKDLEQVYDLLIRQGFKKLVNASLDDMYIKFFADISASHILVVIDDECWTGRDRVLLIQMGTSLTRDLPYIHDCYIAL